METAIAIPDKTYAQCSNLIFNTLIERKFTNIIKAMMSICPISRPTLNANS